MDIAITNQAGVRKIYYEFPSDIASALIHAGIAVQISKPAPASLPVTKWFVTRLPRSGKLAIVCQRSGGETVSFTSPPKDGLKYCDANCPQEVLDEFVRQTTGAVDPEWARDQLAQQKNADAIRQQKEKELTAQYNRG